MNQSVKVYHEVQMAHRLYQQHPESKCYRVHGHSWKVTLTVSGETDETGMILDFAHLKERFRKFLDTTFDHRLLLNDDDPLSEMAIPGVVICKGDPTTERFAYLIWDWADEAYRDLRDDLVFSVEVWESGTNAATCP